MNMPLSRRDFLSISAAGLAFGAAARPLFAVPDRRDFKIALNECSLSRSLKEQKIDHLDFAQVAKKEFGIDAIEYVTSYFSEHQKDEGYIKQMNQRAAEHGVRQVLILVNDAGRLADADAKKRKAAAQNHLPWIDLAKSLGCHSVCVKVAGGGSPKDRQERGAESLKELADYAKSRHLHVLVCANGGKSWKPESLLELLKAVDSRNVGVYPSFTGFDADNPYAAMQQLMPFAKGVRATAKDFDEAGNETSIDYSRMIKLVLDAGYRGYVSINYQGTRLDEFQGIRAAKALLTRTLAAEMQPKKSASS